jgi:transposase
METYVGLDVSKDKIDYAIQKNKGFEQGTIANELSGYKKLANTLMKYADVRIVCETTGVYSFPVCEFFTVQGWWVCEAHAFSIHNYKKTVLQRAKTDPVDAREICNYGIRFGDTLRPKLSKSKEIIELGLLIRLRENLLKSRKRLLGLVEMNSFLSKERLVDLEFETSKKGLDFYQVQYDAYVKNTTKGCVDYCKAHFADTYRCLNSINGLGDVSIPYLIYYTHDFTKFKSIRDFTAYVGVVPNHFESGTSVHAKPRIAKKEGVNSVLRTNIVMVTNVAVKSNPDCKSVFNRFPPETPYKVKLVAATRKLCTIAYKCGRDKVEYVAPNQREIKRLEDLQTA